MSPTDPLADDLRRTVEGAAVALRRLTDGEAATPAAPGKWAPKEVLGHLVDSAANNHARFVSAQLRDDLDFPDYAQDDWVRVQRYAEAPWAELVALWRAYNLHLARVIEAIPPGVRARPRRRHSLDRIAWRTVPADRPATLDDLLRDYVEHLRHHLRQIPGALP